MRVLMFLLTVLFIGCGSGGSSASEVTSDNKIYMGTPLRGGFPFYMKDGSVEWMDGLNFILDENLSRFDYENIKEFNKSAFLKTVGFAKSNKFFTIWVPYEWFRAGSPSEWFPLSSIQEAMKRGYVPVFIYWYFGDRFINTPPSDNDIQTYYEDTKKFADFISGLKGEKIVILEPEFNKPYIDNMDDAKKMAGVYSKAIDIFKNTDKEIKLSLCMMDTGNRGVDETYEKCGYENCALGDLFEWGKADNVYRYLVDKLDYLSFQEMVSQFSRDPENPGSWDNPNYKIYSEREVGIDYLHLRVNNFSAFLYKKYKKPVLLAYVAIASGTWSDLNHNGEIDDNEFNPNGWKSKIVNFYTNMLKIKDSLITNGLFFYAPMELIDDPQHDVGGYQFFGRNEYHLGLIYTSAKDGEDRALYGDLKFKVDVSEISPSR